MIPDQRIVIESTGGVDTVLVWSFTPVDGGTEVSLSFAAQEETLLMRRVSAKVIQQELRRTVEVALGNVKMIAAALAPGTISYPASCAFLIGQQGFARHFHGHVSRALFRADPPRHVIHLGWQTSEVRMEATMSEPIVFNSTGQTVYDQIGGEATFRRLVDAFYARVERDPILRPIFPPDLAQGKEHQFLFLMQFWGGPPRYDALRGHPRLKARHAPFPIGQAERDAWLANMLAAIDEVGIPEPARSQMREYFENGATFMINQR